MGGAKKYFREQVRVNKLLTLDHEEASDFYRASWQTGYSPVPLLCVRLILFLGCVAMLTASMIITQKSIDLVYWPIFMTHWGVIFITVSSGGALFVSVMATVKGSLDEDKLPWYVKVYWAWFTMSLNIAFFITVFYYVLLYPYLSSDGMDPVLDAFVHGVNSLVMLCLLVTARHPLHLFHFLYPFLAAISYMIFTIIYYFAGGTNHEGGSYIYPMLDWSNPGPTTGVVFGVIPFLLVLHVFAMALSLLRTSMTHRCVGKNASLLT